MEYPTTKQGWLDFVHTRYLHRMPVNRKYFPQLHEVRILRDLIKKGTLIRIREGSSRSQGTFLTTEGSKVFMDAHDTVNVEESGSLPARTAKISHLNKKSI